MSLLMLALVSQRLYSWPVPNGYAWEIGIGVTEWGHLVGLAALLLFLLGLRYNRVAAGLALVAAAIALQPIVAAMRLSDDFSVATLFTGLTTARPPSRTEVYSGEQALDLYLPTTPAAPGGSPTVIVVHGGSWARGGRGEFSGLNNYLQERGFLVASIDYRLAPQNPYPAALEDLDAAFHYLVIHAEEFHIDTGHIYWLGRSAGAHLALLEAYRQTFQPLKPRAVIAFYPPTDLTWSYDHPSNPNVLDSCAAIRDFLGGTPQEKPDAYRESSPYLSATSQSVPTLLLHGGSDDLVYFEQSRRLAAHLDQLGVGRDLLYIPWANHGFDINLNGPSGQLSTAAVLRFLKRF